MNLDASPPGRRRLIGFQRLWRSMLCAFCLGSVFAPGAQARDVALLMGVGEYHNPKFNLNGIDRDLELMRETARRLGFDAENIRILSNEQLTVPNIERAFTDWLVPEAGESDRVLLYFSGHGSQVPDDDGDEEDGSDEVLTMHDLAIVKKTAATTLAGVLKDDDLNRLLKTLRSRDVLLLVDACHSGTAAKGAALTVERSYKSLGDDGVQSKFLYYPGMPDSRRFSTKSLTSTSHEGLLPGEGFAMLAAAADHERALATLKGSVFTQAIHDAVEQATRDGATSLTLEHLRDVSGAFIAHYIETAAPGHERHNPQLTGDPDLARRNLLATASTTRDDPRQRTDAGETSAEPAAMQLQRLLEAAVPLRISLLSGTRLEEGDLLRLSVEIPDVKGYLNILEIDDQERIRVLFPNRFQPDNRVVKGTLELPDPDCVFGPNCFDWTIQAPFGPSRLVALFSDGIENPVFRNPVHGVFGRGR